MIRNFFNLIILFSTLFSLYLYPQSSNSNLSGFVTDKLSGEALIGTNILVYRDSLTENIEPLTGASCNSYGFFVIPQLNAGLYFLIVRHIGYKTVIEEVTLEGMGKSKQVNVELVPENIELEEVIVEGKKEQKKITSTIDVSPDFLKKLPSLSGEVDLFKMLELLPGVNKASEISTGLYLRGGSPDQTLTLVDGVTVYNPSHLGNIASTFNTNALRDVRLIKGAFPAEYGGRLSSILDIKLRSGTKEKEKGIIGLGLINSFATLEGPMTKNSTYMISGRYMYYDLIQETIDEKSSVPRYNFYDLSAKVNYNLSKSSIFSISAVYNFDNAYSPPSDEIEYDIKWNNVNLSLNWLQISSGSLFLNSTLSFIKYEFSSKIGIDPESVNTSSYFSNPDLTDLTFRQSAELNWKEDQKFKTGFEISYHNYDLLYSDVYSDALEKDPYAGKNINALEAALFIQNESLFFNFLRTNLGGRFYYFGDRRSFRFEPRLSLSAEIFSNVFLKGAASLAHQFLHLILRNDISLPTDLWYPSTNKIEPARSIQYVFGVNTFLYDEEYEIALEGYYRDMKNLYEYTNSVTLNPLNDSIEDQFVKGEGEAYGIELFINKRVGSFTGWIGYTLAWTRRKFDDLNGGKIFYPKYDRRHDVSLVLAYDIFKNLKAGLTWTYATGERFSLPPGQFYFTGVGVQTNEELNLYYSSLNSSKFPAYHKLDLNFSYNFIFSGLELQTYVNIYNLYNRQNAFAQFIVFEEDENEEEVARLKRITLFPFIPSIGVSVRF